MEIFLDKLKTRETGATLCRILVSLVLLKDFLLYLINRELLFGTTSIFPDHHFKNILHSYHLDVLENLFQQPDSTFAFIFFALILSIIFLLGIANQISGLLLFACLWLMKSRNIFIMDGADNVLWLMYPMLAFVKSRPLINYKHSAPEKKTNHSRSLIENVSRLAIAGITIQLCLIYLFAAISKLTREVWQDGTALYYILRMDDFRQSDFNFFLTQYAFPVKFGTYIVLLWESLFPFMIWFRATKQVVVLTGIVMHFGIFLFMRVDNFSLVMLSFYPILFSNEELRITQQKITHFCSFIFNKSVRLVWFKKNKISP